MIVAVSASPGTPGRPTRLADGSLPAGAPAWRGIRPLAEALARTTHRPAREDLR
ncbi:hypothetical protein SAMN05216574_108140 [Blastococcus tunisiensis]|uniref:Uncharacterized protein n=1 Tax=Blastococcus tunisiensis TaxID=1798228 RepID=A0A1I2FKA7_9ACTN|nr:hypothetical protein SAMN05216574_108140 [Blastococcus sp. DSM 46838]